MLPPSVPVETVRAALRGQFGLSGDLAALDGERDQNFRLSASDKVCVVKVCNPAEGFALATAQLAALRHIERVDPSLPVPRVVAPLSGELVGRIEHGGRNFPLMVLHWLPGSVMGDSEYSPGHYLSLGKVIGRLTRSLRGFVDAAFTGRKLAWNTVHFSPSPADIARLPVAARPVIEALTHDFVASLRPRLAALPAHVIHGDVHPFNILIGRQREISGIIDFGDMIHGPRVLDIANALADCLVPGRDCNTILHNMVAGYVTEVSLEEAEIGVVVGLMRVRLATTAIITANRRSMGAAVTPQIAALDSISLDLLTKLDWAGASTVIHSAALGRRYTVSQKASSVLPRRLAAMGPKPLLFYDEPLHVVKGDGVWLTAADGRRYLDCYNNVPHVGHANPHVAEAVARQMRQLNTNTRYLTEEAIAYAEQLKATLHPSLDAVIFVNSGSEANDVAWRMANSWSGHRGALCMDFAYHGVTMAADMLSPSNYPPGCWNAPLVRQLEAPDRYRDGVGTDDDFAVRYAAMADSAIRSLQEAGPGVSIAIMDSAFMTNGIINAPAGYVAGVMGRVHAAGGLFIADEVQSGFGRMGTHMWGHQHHGVVPDMVTIGKPAGNGYPIGAIITRAEILARFVEETGPFFSTFGGGNAACAAGLAVLGVMEREDLCNNSLTTGAYLRQELAKLKLRHALIGDVRGSGLAIGVELVRDKGTLEPAAAETRQVINALRHEGVLVGSDGKGGNVLKIRPPIVFNRDHADLAAAALDRVLSRFA
jgi:4-aminobutyrate aminotransferase-like enzyme/aminoglycoside phosphotransferase (APT) family kinase protein